MSEFSEKLKELRVAKGVTQKKVAEYIGVEPRNVILYESGKGRPSAPTTILLAQYFNIPIEELLSDKRLITAAKISPSAKIFEGAIVKGDVTLKENVGIWYNAVVRGDIAPIIIGANSNVQECSSLHVDHDFPLIIGEYVTVGHGAILHGCSVGDNTIIGMGSIVLNGAKIGKNCIVGAGALVIGNTEIPDNSLVIGNPAKVKREVREDEIKHSIENALEYVAMIE